MERGGIRERDKEGDKREKKEKRERDKIDWRGG